MRLRIVLGHVAVLEKEFDGGEPDDHQADAGGQAFEEGGLDSLAQHGFEGRSDLFRGHRC